MDFAIVPKGQKFDFSLVSKQTTLAKLYVGAGWDMAQEGADVDLDLVAVLLTDGKVTNKDHLIYFSNRVKSQSLGVFLSEDNVTGEGDGDDESIVIDFANLPTGVNGIALGLICYTGGITLPETVNTHLRICDGDNEQSEQVADVEIEGATAGSTVVHGMTVSMNAEGHWIVENVDTFHNCGNGIGAVQGFGQLFT
ncbi:MAG: hypothetical protein COB09_18790 [Thalassobium sp.]|nr:MAG: hypothetical protein COB09_18790 [Thalassobium sp.]